MTTENEMHECNGPLKLVKVISKENKTLPQSFFKNSIPCHDKDPYQCYLGCPVPGPTKQNSIVDLLTSMSACITKSAYNAHAPTQWSTHWILHAYVAQSDMVAANPIDILFFVRPDKGHGATYGVALDITGEGDILNWVFAFKQRNGTYAKATLGWKAKQINGRTNNYLYREQTIIQAAVAWSSRLHTASTAHV